MKKKKITKKSKKKISKIDKKILKKYKQMLIERKNNLIKEVEKRLNDGKEYNKSDVMDSADQATDSYENELLYGLNNTEKKYLEEVENALERVEDGTYGKCNSCSKPISFERLKSLPFAKFCVVCQEKNEKPTTRR